MKQSMSRVAHCIDNGPMEGFLGILKQEMYYCQHFNDRTTLIAKNTSLLQQKFVLKVARLYQRF